MAGSSAAIYSLANHPTTELLDPFEIQRRRLAIQNALVEQRLREQEFQRNSLAMDAMQRDQAAEDQFRAQYGGGAPAGAPGAPVMPAAAPAASAGPGSAAWDPSAASVLPQGAPPAMAPPGGGPPPAAMKTPAGAAPVNIPDSSLYAAFGSKAPGIIKARNEADAAAAARNKSIVDAQETQGKIREQDQKYWGTLAGGWEHSGYDPRALPGMLQMAAGHGLGNTPEYQQFAQLAQGGDLEGLKRLASMAITPEIRKSISEAGNIDASRDKSNEETLKSRINRGASLLGSTPANDGGRGYQTAIAALKQSDPEVIEKGGFDTQWTPQSAAKALKIGSTPAEQVTAAETAKRDTATEANERRARDQEQQNINLRAKVYNQQYGNPLEGATDAELTTARMRAAGKLPLPAPRTKGYDRAVAMAAAVDTSGTFQQNAGTRFDTIKNFKEKGDSDQIVQLATALEHLERAKQNSAAMGTEPTIGTNLFPTQRRYRQDVMNATDEIGRLIKNSVVTGEESKRAIDNLMSPFQSNRDAGLDELTNLMGGKVSAKIQKFNVGTGLPLPASYFNAETQKRLKESGYGSSGIDWNDKDIQTAAPAASAPTAAAPAPAAPAAAPAAPASTTQPFKLPAGSVSVTDPAGGVHYFPDQTKANEFKRLANIR